MDYLSAQEIYQQLKAQITSSDEDLMELFDDFVRYAIEYARSRADWQLMNHQERVEVDAYRSRKHDAFIASCNALARYIDKMGGDCSWRNKLTDQRKVIGDFACFLHCILGIEAR